MLHFIQPKINELVVWIRKSSCGNFCCAAESKTYNVLFAAADDCELGLYLTLREMTVKFLMQFLVSQVNDYSLPREAG